jgi:hypothetical protein
MASVCVRISLNSYRRNALYSGIRLVNTCKSVFTETIS